MNKQGIVKSISTLFPTEWHSATTFGANRFFLFSQILKKLIFRTHLKCKSIMEKKQIESKVLNPILLVLFIVSLNSIAFAGPGNIATQAKATASANLNKNFDVSHVNDGMVNLAKEYQDAGIAFVIISSNNVEKYPQDSPEKMTEFAKESGYSFPYLYDESQEVAKAYDAACTPDFYVFDGAANLVYRGQMDGSRPGSEIPVTGEDLRAALDAVLVSRPANPVQRPSAGCGIKWK